MRSLFLICSVALLQVACIDLGFESPQPEGQRNIGSVPGKFEGTYTNQEDTLSFHGSWLVSGNDSISIQPSDTLVIRKWKGWYFFNMTESKHHYWTVACAKVKGDKLILLLPQIVREDKEMLTQFGGVEELIDENNNLDAYIIDPSRSDWGRLLDSRLFAENVFERVQEDD